MEIVDDDPLINGGSQKSQEQELNNRNSQSSGGIPIDRATLEITERIKRQSQERENHRETEESQIQEIYDKLNRNRASSVINERLLETLEEFVIRQRAKKEDKSARENRGSNQRHPDNDDI